MKKAIQLILTPILLVLCGACAAGAYTILEDAQGTGGAGEIKGLIDPIIDRAISAVQSNNSQLALEELYTLQQELDDTFAVEEEEENEEQEKEDGEDKK
jgi:hypothetical protein